MHIIANSTVNLNIVSGNSSNKQHTPLGTNTSPHTKNPARASTMAPERSASITLPLQKNSPEKNLDEVLSTLKITSTSTLIASSQQQQQQHHQQQQKLEQNQQKSPLSHCPSISHMSHAANGRVEGPGKKFSTEKLSIQDNNEDDDCQELDYYSEAGEDSYQLSYNGSGDFSDSDSDFLPVNMDDEDDDDEEYERASYDDDDDDEEEYEPASYEDDYDCDVSVMSAEQEDDSYDDIAETPFWYSFEEYDQVQSIFRAYEKEVIRTEQGVRSVRPFVARIKRTNVSLTQAFQTLDEVQICNHQRIDPRKCFPLVKKLILLTTWDPEEGLPQKFQILEESHILDFWKARVKGYPSYLYCFPTLDSSESFLYEVSAEDQPITYSDQGLRDPILQYLPPKEWDLFPLDDNGDGEGEASCLRG